jgi:hypothetical protein
MNTPTLDPQKDIAAKLAVLEVKIDILLSRAGMSKEDINKIHREFYAASLAVQDSGVASPSLPPSVA